PPGPLGPLPSALQSELPGAPPTDPDQPLMAIPVTTPPAAPTVPPAAAASRPGDREPRRRRGWRPQRVVPIVVLVALFLAAGTAADARAALDRAGAGFVVSAERRNDETIAAGRVVDQQPPAGKAPPGSEIHLVISDGPKPVEVPNVVGKTYDDAARALTAKRFKVTRTDEFSDTVPAGQVIRHEPVAGAAAPRDSPVPRV